MVTDKSIELIKKHEGLRLTPYKDTEGILTVGYGHNLEQNITEMDAWRLLREDLQTVENDLHQFGWYRGLDEVRRAVVQNMVFNLGGPRFAKFKKTIGFIETGQYHQASEEMLDSKWANQVGRRATELSYMMRTGQYQ